MFHCYLDDFTTGSIFETEGKTLSEAEILDFAFKYDPQPFHMDVEAAKEGPFGGLIASGLHTMAIGLRLILQAQIFAPGASLGSPGIDEIRWLKPVLPGDMLRVRGETLKVTPSRSKPDRGIVKIRTAIFNQHGEEVMSMLSMQIVKRRAAD
ncbi:MAG: MaoC family dehydratase [Alphaproteobacteria bacterium]|jgi:acyl dehydratase|nr:MaoC family dehydratase [Alphaproteobacteria bacterium]MDP6816904.1 MaoC family dehydratase [Alphaproteobacteria bacterium]|tara:strand:- start:324 stop:779 length:456 start_codon:yes stop_codon:yes gene_type:complete